jgi:hypothetical protein
VIGIADLARRTVRFRGDLGVSRITNGRSQAAGLLAPAAALASRRRWPSTFTIDFAIDGAASSTVRLLRAIAAPLAIDGSPSGGVAIGRGSVATGIPVDSVGGSSAGESKNAHQGGQEPG